MALEYLVVNTDFKPPAVEGKCNEMGRDGWRLVSTVLYLGGSIVQLCFERDKV